MGGSSEVCNVGHGASDSVLPCGWCTFEIRSEMEVIVVCDGWCKSLFPFGRLVFGSSVRFLDFGFQLETWNRWKFFVQRDISSLGSLTFIVTYGCFWKSVVLYGQEIRDVPHTSNIRYTPSHASNNVHVYPSSYFFIDLQLTIHNCLPGLIFPILFSETFLIHQEARKDSNLLYKPA